MRKREYHADKDDLRYAFREKVGGRRKGHCLILLPDMLTWDRWMQSWRDTSSYSVTTGRKRQPRKANPSPGEAPRGATIEELALGRAGQGDA